MESIGKSTEDYERWLGRHLRLIPADLALKHQEMKDDCFSFFRATYYRWVERWPEICGGLNSVCEVLAVGDLHAENFGTWRDADGRLAWGINDFDEAHPGPYTLDLVRLAASVLLANRARHLVIKPKKACNLILAGYERGLREGGRPVVLGDRHDWLSRIMLKRAKNRVLFWRRIKDLKTWQNSLPPGVKEILEASLPEKGMTYRVVHRQAGLGSLGRERLCAIADWRGGWVARETKALAPSAWIWRRSGAKNAPLHYGEIMHGAIRSRDWSLSVTDGWVVRRIAVDCSRIELARLPGKYDEERMLLMMGVETANVHLGTRGATSAILRDLARRESKWLWNAARRMVRAVEEDWRDWGKWEKRKAKKRKTVIDTRGGKDSKK